MMSLFFNSVTPFRFSHFNAGAQLTNFVNLEETMKFGMVIELEKHVEILGHSVSLSLAIFQQFTVFA